MRDREPEPWLDRAEQDLEAARILARAQHPVLEIAAYQQSAEKLLKGMLIAMENRPPRTHQIKNLIAMIPQTDPARQDLQGLDNLDSYFRAFRYPDSDISVDVPSSADLDRWSDELERLMAAIRARIDSDGKLT